MQPCPSAARDILSSFRSIFTAPGFQNFSTLVVGWLLLGRKQAICRIARVMRIFGFQRHHTALHRFLSLGRWELDEVGRVIFGLFVNRLAPTALAIVDDTLCTKSGRQIYGIDVHFDITRSAPIRGISALGFGHNWVVLAIAVPCPWNFEKSWAVPVLFRLYRGKRNCPDSKYRTRPELAREMIGILASWMPADKKLHVTGDSAYCCKTVIQGLPAAADFLGPLPLNAALYELPEKRLSKRGRPARKGYRIANPKTTLENRPYHPKQWSTRSATLYGEAVEVECHTQKCIWYHPAGTKPVRVVIVPDRRGPASSGRAYVCTDADMDPTKILETYARRWQLEVTFRDLKQELGFEGARNGWWRRKAGHRDDPCRKAQRRRRGQKAVERTAPMAGVVFALALAWYLNEDRREKDVKRLRKASPWNRNKNDVSVADMLDALRGGIWAKQFRGTRLPDRIRQNSQELWSFLTNAA